MPILQWNASKKEPISRSEAIERIMASRHQQRTKIAQSLALRAAQLKYLMNRGKESPWSSWTRIGETHPLFPPMQANKIIDYALHAHALFQPAIYQEWVSKAKKLSPTEQQSFVAWLSEWEEVLDEMRRMTAQHLSSMPEEKIAEELSHIAQWEEEQHLNITLESAATRKMQSLQEEIRNASARLAELQQSDSFRSTKRLIDAQLEWQAQKQGLEQEWMRNWEMIRPAMEILSNETLMLERMELSAIQLLQNYVKNPWQARARDAHASGLKMLMELALQEVKKNEWPLPTAQMQEYERRLESTREGKFFEYYFWKSNEVESNGQAVRKELESNPHYKEWVRLRTKVAALSEQAREAEQEAMTAADKLAQLERQTREKIRSVNALIPDNWNWSISEEY